jgi:UDP-hydrolysing UDP-N-acetyl-D-glucosamine 2-epimerase
MKIVGATSCRSEYDLMSGIYRALAAEPGVEFRLLASGAHFSPSYGLSIRQIEADGLEFLGRIDSLLDGGTPSARVKSAAIAMAGITDLLAGWQPDLVLVAGDRENELVTAMVCAYLKIPCLHFFGGDHATDGNVDNPARHAISKLATAHAVAHERHRDRLLAMGEHPSRIFVVGSPALDKFRAEPCLERDALLGGIAPGRRVPDSYAVMIFHPILSVDQEEVQAGKMILDALASAGIFTFVSAPNADSGSRKLLEVFAEHGDHPGFHFYKNLPRATFVNLLRNASFLIGNSSMGLLEAPSIPLPAVNVGMRQRDRLAARNVVFVDAEPEAIRRGIRQVSEPGFRASLAGMANPYGNGQSVASCVDLIRRTDFAGMLLKREDPLQKNP